MHNHGNVLFYHILIRPVILKAYLSTHNNPRLVTMVSQNVIGLVNLRKTSLHCCLMALLAWSLLMV